MDGCGVEDYVTNPRWGICYPRTVYPIPVGLYVLLELYTHFPLRHMFSTINITRSIEQLTRFVKKPKETKKRVSYIFLFIYISI